MSLCKASVDGGGPGCGVFPDLALGERRCGFGERLEDALLGRPGLRRGLGRQRAGGDARRGPPTVIGEFDHEVVEAGGCAMLDGHDDLLCRGAAGRGLLSPQA